MKIEYVYAPQPEPGRRSVARSVPVYYYYTGEMVGPGHYVCTFCGHHTMVVTGARTLPPCGSCDSAEFSLLAAAA